MNFNKHETRLKILEKYKTLTEFSRQSGISLPSLSRIFNSNRSINSKTYSIFKNLEVLVSEETKNFNILLNNSVKFMKRKALLNEIENLEFKLTYIKDLIISEGFD
jgi:hypothetical protein